ncbi:amidohydrolase [Microbulbifer agarilyticus]|uniref:amidohydrolase n=1 Tax=Microbulbifer agarilyticus TaxID=260552 RepID=UPI0009864561|nr:amidohydrolase [Microbulbifer agarilyticus]
MKVYLGMLLAVFVLIACTVEAADTPAKTADTIYTGGPILTMDDKQPKADAVAVKDGRIIAVGRLADLEKYKGTNTKEFDLNGRAMVPGFVDSHGHVVFGGLQALSANLLSPPDGKVTDIASLKSTLSQWAKDNADAVAATKMIIGFGYDNAQLKELRHPTREDLDEVSQDIPVLIVHQSGHLGVANSKALEMAGINKDSKAPAGGVIQRDDSGEPNGVLEEYAFFSVFVPLLGQLGDEGLVTFARAGSNLWAKFGYTTGQDGRSSEAAVKALKKAAADGDILIDVVAFPDVLEGRDFIKQSMSRDYVDNVRVGGCKLTIDGSPQGFTALRDRPYYDPVGKYPKGYKGYSAITQEQLQDAVNWCFEHGLQIIVHSNGEGASDMLIAAFKKAREKYGDPGNRPVLVHGQFQREDQVDSFKDLGVFQSVFPMHTFYWGDWHREHTVGPKAAENISPTGWIRKRGLMFGTHHDAPVAFPDSMRVLDATVNRRTRSGYILGPEQRVDVNTALKAMTIWPAWQHFEEDDKGSIEVGKLADFVVLSEDPTAVPSEKLADLKVLKTIKKDKVIFESKPGEPSARLRYAPFSNSPEAGHHVLDALVSGMSKD